MSTTIPPGKVGVSLEYLGVLAATAERNGTQRNFIDVALQWAESANAEIQRLTAALAAAQQAAPAAPVGAPSERWRLALSVCDAALGQCQPCAEANCGVVQRDYIDTARAAAAALLRPATPTPPGEAP
jgi:hypothetical protein